MFGRLSGIARVMYDHFILMVNSIKVFETLVTSSNNNCTLPWEIRQHNQFMITVKSLQVCGKNNFLWRSALLLDDKLILADIIMCSTKSFLWLYYYTDFAAKFRRQRFQVYSSCCLCPFWHLI